MQWSDKGSGIEPRASQVHIHLLGVFHSLPTAYPATAIALLTSSCASLCLLTVPYPRLIITCVTPSPVLADRGGSRIRQMENRQEATHCTYKASHRRPEEAAGGAQERRTAKSLA